MEGASKSEAEDHQRSTDTLTTDQQVTDVVRQSEGHRPLHADIKKLSSEVLALQQEILSVRGAQDSLHQDLAVLECAKSGLCSENKKLRDDFKIMHKNYGAALQELAEIKLYIKTFQADHSKLLENQDNLRLKNDELQKDINNWRTGHQSDVGKLQTQLDDTVKDTMSMREEMASKQQENQRLHDQINCQELVLNQLQSDQNDQRTDNDVLKQETDALRTDYRTLQSTIEQQQIQQNNVLKDVTSIREEMRSKQDLTTLSEAYTTLCQENQQLRADIGSLQSDLNQLQTNHDNFQSELARLRADHRKLSEDQHHLKAEVSAEMSSLQMTQTKLHKDMDTVRTDQKTLQADMTTLQKEHTETVLAEQRLLQQRQDTLIPEVDTLKTDVQQMKTSLQESLDKATSAITELKTMLGNPKRLFHVGRLNKERTKRYGAMLFDNVKLNDGDHYDTQTGVFTAPRTGLYFFTATVENAREDSSVYAFIMVDEDAQCVVQGGFLGASGCVLVPLKAGQVVWLYTFSSVHLFGTADVSSSFSGMVVWPSL